MRVAGLAARLVAALPVLARLLIGALLITALAIVPRLIVTAIAAVPVGPVPVGSPVAAPILALAVLAAIVAALLTRADRLALVAIFLVHRVEIIHRANGTMIVLTGAAVAQHAEIMVGELQVIFGGDPIALHLRVPRHVAVFLEHLGGVAAGAAVDPVAAVALTLAAAT